MAERVGAAPARRTAAVPAAAGERLRSVDALRGFVMVVMLLDHIRETFFLHMQVSDPVDARTVVPALFAMRTVTMICAPAFVFLTGLSAWLYGSRHSRAETAGFLLKRGLFLMLLEVTLVGFAWSGRLVPGTLWLQVIWAIGLSMIALAALIHLPRCWIVVGGVAIVAGHNLLDAVRLTPGDPFHTAWAMLHQRSAFDVAGVTVKTTYPVLPWIGVIALGYAAGPWFAAAAGDLRRRRLMTAGAALLLLFVVLRVLNVYGDRPWFVVEGDALRTLMSFLALTKYPPSLLFLSLALGVSLILLAQFERLGGGAPSRWLVVLGGAPMFFYLLHLLVLRALYTAAAAVWGPQHGAIFHVDRIAWLWLLYAALIVPLYAPTAWFSALKKRRKDIGWLKYL